MDLRIKSAKNFNVRSKTIAFGRFLFAFIIGIIIGIFTDDPNLSAGAPGLGFLIGVLISIRTRLVMNEDFSCKDCGSLIKRKIPNSGADYEPILYHCKKCEILWHTGNINN